MAFSMASARPNSKKNSAGPPMPNEVRDARASPSFTPGSSRSQATLDFVRQVIAQLFDIAGAHEEDQVIGADDLFQRFLRLGEIADVDATRNLMREVGRLNAGDVVLAGAVDVEHVYAVRAGERAREVVHQRAQAGVPMRLEDHHKAAVAQLARRLDRRAHLRWMVRVMGVHRRALKHPQELHAPVRAWKGLQRSGHVAETDAELERHSGGGWCGVNVVGPRLPQGGAAGPGR